VTGLALPAADTSDDALTSLTATLAATAEHYDRTAEFPWEPLKAVHDRPRLPPRVGGHRG
jgi:hypothetical protein